MVGGMVVGLVGINAASQAPTRDGPEANSARAIMLGGDITANAEGFTRVIGDWNIPVENAASSLDVLFVAAQKTGAPLDSLTAVSNSFAAVPMRQQ